MDYTFTPLHFVQVPETNARRARCQRCRRDLAPRTGFAWVLEANHLSSPAKYYYCPACSTLEAVEQQALEQSALALTIIGEALQFSAPLGFVNERRVVRAIRAAGDQAPQAAQAVADAFQRGERLSVWDVVFAIQNAQKEEQ